VEDDEEDAQLLRNINGGGGMVGMIGGYEAFGDCDGHGTHIAATAAGGEVGVAASAVVHPVRVLGCDGGGRASDVVAVGLYKLNAVAR
jgi:subtilisin family serine protease